jgi:predicted nucleotidyltransferase component of viral defense system
VKEAYKKQVALLLDILPEVAKEDVFALHGGTAINLFCLNMPRLSVDIDLTYISVGKSRDVDLKNIRSVLGRVRERLRKQLSSYKMEIAKYPQIERYESSKV